MITPEERQRLSEIVTPFQPMGRTFIEIDLRHTSCDRDGSGSTVLAFYGDSTGGYAYSPDNNDAAIGVSYEAALQNKISESSPLDSNVKDGQDFAGKYILSIVVTALDILGDEYTSTSFTGNVLRVFGKGQAEYRADGSGNKSNGIVLLHEIELEPLGRRESPRTKTFKIGAYVSPSQNIFLGLDKPQPYNCTLEVLDLQYYLWGRSSQPNRFFANGEEQGDSASQNPSPQNAAELVIKINSASWAAGLNYIYSDQTQTTPSPTPPLPSSIGVEGNDKKDDKKDDGKDPNQPSPSGSSGGSDSKKSNNPPTPSSPPGGCSPPAQNCGWYKVDIPSNVGKAQVNVGDYSKLCPKGQSARGVVEFSTAGSYVLCCDSNTYPPNDLGCSTSPPPGTKWTCVNGTCISGTSGPYNSKTECEASLKRVVKMYTLGWCQPGQPSSNCILDSPPSGTLIKTYTINQNQYPLSAVIDNRIPPGFVGYNHHSIKDALGVELEYYAASGAGYYFVDGGYACPS